MAAQVLLFCYVFLFSNENRKKKNRRERTGEKRKKYRTGNGRKKEVVACVVDPLNIPADLSSIGHLSGNGRDFFFVKKKVGNASSHLHWRRQKNDLFFLFRRLAQAPRRTSTTCDLFNDFFMSYLHVVFVFSCLVTCYSRLAWLASISIPKQKIKFHRAGESVGLVDSTEARREKKKAGGKMRRAIRSFRAHFDHLFIGLKRNNGSENDNDKIADCIGFSVVKKIPNFIL